MRGSHTLMFSLSSAFCPTRGVANHLRSTSARFQYSWRQSSSRGAGMLSALDLLRAGDESILRAINAGDCRRLRSRIQPASRFRANKEHHTALSEASLRHVLITQDKSHVRGIKLIRTLTRVSRTQCLQGQEMTRDASLVHPVCWR